LSVAIVYNDSYIVKELINAGANMNLTNKFGISSLMLSTTQKNSDIISLLIEKGANIYITNNNGQTALDFISKREIRIYNLFKDHIQ